MAILLKASLRKQTLVLLISHQPLKLEIPTGEKLVLQISFTIFTIQLFTKLHTKFYRYEKDEKICFIFNAPIILIRNKCTSNNGFGP